jgi:hypothetical protein
MRIIAIFFSLCGGKMDSDLVFHGKNRLSLLDIGKERPIMPERR